MIAEDICEDVTEDDDLRGEPFHCSVCGMSFDDPEFMITDHYGRYACIHEEEFAS